MTNDRVTRMGNTVRRPAAFWSPAVHGLLRYLESACFPAPRASCPPSPATATAPASPAPKPSPGSRARPAPTSGRTSSPSPACNSGPGSSAATTTQSPATARPPPACGPAARGPARRRNHLPRRLRPVEHGLAERRDRRAHRLGPRPARPAPVRRGLRAGVRRPVPRQRGVRPPAPLPRPARPPPDRGVLRRLRHRGPRRHRRPRRKAAARTSPAASSRRPPGPATATWPSSRPASPGPKPAACNEQPRPLSSAGLRPAHPPQAATADSAPR
jgi:translation initiation factor IF-2